MCKKKKLKSFPKQTIFFANVKVFCVFRHYLIYFMLQKVNKSKMYFFWVMR